jgi:hypothetical protein
MQNIGGCNLLMHNKLQLHVIVNDCKHNFEQGNTTQIQNLWSWSQSCRFDVKISYVYYSMGHMWSQYRYMVLKNLWKIVRFGILKPIHECHMSNVLLRNDLVPDLICSLDCDLTHGFKLCIGKAIIIIIRPTYVPLKINILVKYIWL